MKGRKRKEEHVRDNAVHYSYITVSEELTMN